MGVPKPSIRNQVSRVGVEVFDIPLVEFDNIKQTYIDSH